jgi:hypothetical protein
VENSDAESSAGDLRKFTEKKHILKCERKLKNISSGTYPHPMGAHKVSGKTTIYTFCVKKNKTSHVQTNRYFTIKIYRFYISHTINQFPVKRLGTYIDCKGSQKNVVNILKYVLKYFLNKGCICP